MRRIGETRILHRPIHDIIRFDLGRGIFDLSGVSDPIDLIPLYPNQMVSLLGDTWTPTVAVKINYGTGTGQLQIPQVENIA